ncbi:hypothetical protein F7725_013948 [Dissostichus mawsoni]|uniref:Palmitoyltransferase n=1 Tax=Dissostichus mawsoni TaxID=36200 RepID=A0A7J5YUY7_DISMA|nr:hypothetical protein F7725_013948 [Dissostichus mawsoni]
MSLRGYSLGSSSLMEAILKNQLRHVSFAVSFTSSTDQASFRDWFSSSMRSSSSSRRVRTFSDTAEDPGLGAFPMRQQEQALCVMAGVSAAANMDSGSVPSIRELRGSGGTEEEEEEQEEESVCRKGGGGMGSSWRWHLSRTMRLAMRWCRGPQRGGGCGGNRPWISGRCFEVWSYSKMLLRSLYFNSLTNADTLLDCAFEPVYWIVDNVTRWFGVVFVCLVVLLTTSVVVIIYLFVLPTILSTYPLYMIVWHLCYGHWLLVMEKTQIPVVSICKKCITPKPPRTHHCSICNHVFPAWLNNCVGHFNHRYFLSFCLYTTLGCVYCSISSKDMFLDAYNTIERYYQTPPPTEPYVESTAHKSIIFLWVLTSLWHMILISRGETSVERHINHKETRRLKDIGKVFKNPYHHGTMNNWKLLLGVEKRSHWFTRVLLPSSHPPNGDGILWEFSFSRRDPMAI